jgi:hypothetical protein
MNYQASKFIIEKYINALAKGIENNGIARYQSLLPCSKEKIHDAFKIFLAHSIHNRPLPSVIFEKYLEASLYIDDFIEDEKAKIINELHALGSYKEIMKDENKSKIFFDYKANKSADNKHLVLVAFTNRIKELDYKSTDYCKKIYDLAEIKYYEDYENDF